MAVTTVAGAAKKLGKCVRCLTDRRATTTERVTIGDTTTELEVCDQHADLFRADLFRWTRLGTPIDVEARPPLLRPVPDEEQSRPTAYGRPARRGSNVRVQVPVGPRVVEEHPAEPEPWRDQVPAEVVRALGGDVPAELRAWALSNLARRRADEAHIDLLAVMLAAALPETTRPSTEDPNIHLHTRGDITAVVCPGNKTVLTVLRRSEEGSPRGYRAS